MNHASLKRSHPRIVRLVENELRRQRSVVNLIASENFVSDAVLEALGTTFTNKYAEGKPGQRYYFGNEVVDEIERYAQELALKTFGLSGKAWSVNVQPYSGSTANLAVYAALLERGDTVLAMSLEHGGHLTHGHKASMTGKWWNFVHYGVGKDGYIDYGEVLRLAKKHRPKLIVCGGSAYPRTLDFRKFSSIAGSIGAYLMADVSHIAGLIAGKAHPSPFPYADAVTTTTHKTLRGPRAALIMSKKSVADKIDRAVFPGLQGGPHLNTICAMAVMFEEARKPSFRRYAEQVVDNARALAQELKRRGFLIVSGGTDNHLMLVDVTPFGMSGKEAGELLEKAGVIVNKNMIPFDTRKPLDPSGIRLGTPALTTLGMKEKEMKSIANLIADVVTREVSPLVAKRKVSVLVKKFT